MSSQSRPAPPTCRRLREQGAAQRASWSLPPLSRGVCCCRHFVPNLTLGAPIVKALRKHTAAYLDCHLMVTNPEKWVDDFAEAGASGFTFHVEVDGAFGAIHC